MSDGGKEGFLSANKFLCQSSPERKYLRTPTLNLHLPSKAVRNRIYCLFKSSYVSLFAKKRIKPSCSLCESLPRGLDLYVFFMSLSLSFYFVFQPYRGVTGDIEDDGQKEEVICCPTCSMLPGLQATNVSILLITILCMADMYSP